MLIWIVFLVIGLVASMVLVIHLSIELNRIDKTVIDLVSSLRKHYGIE